MRNDLEVNIIQVYSKEIKDFKKNRLIALYHGIFI